MNQLKKYISSNLPGIVLAALSLTHIPAATAQAKLVINGGIINITNSASLVIDNPDNTAITRTTGYIQSEGANNTIIWTIGAGNGNTYLLPFGNQLNYLPFQFNAAGGSGPGGQIIFSTYATPTWKNSDALPAGVTNLIRNGSDNSSKVIDRFWQINPQGYATKPTFSNTIFTYSDLEYAAPNAIVEASLVPQRWNNTVLSWNDYLPGSSINTSNNTVGIPLIPGNQLYDWWTLVDASFALPVTLTFFKASVQNQTVVTSWQTAVENNSGHFEVWRSNSLPQFDSIGSMAAAGNSSSLLDYSLTDYHPYKGISYYRLKIIDRDGSAKWSSIVRVVLNNAVTIALSPNPATNTLHLVVSSEVATAKPVAFLYDSKGSLLRSFTISHTFQDIDIMLLPAGLYHLSFVYHGNLQTQSFIKQ